MFRARIWVGIFWGDDLAVLAEHVAEWANVIEIDVHPVVEDAQAAEAAAKVFGK